MFTPNLGLSWSNLSIFFRWVETNHHLESYFGLIWIPFWTGGWMTYTLIQVFCPLLTWAMKKTLDVSYSRYVFWVLKRSLKIPRLSYFNFGLGSPFHRSIPASAPAPTSPVGNCQVQSRRGFLAVKTGAESYCLFMRSWESKGTTPPMLPYQEIMPYSGIINYHDPLIKPY